MLSLLLSSFLAVTSVAAQSATSTTSANAACTSATFNINSASDLTTLAACTNVQGNVIIADTVATVNFGGITQISGNVEIINNGSTSTLAATSTITGSSLQSIGGVFTLTQLTQLNTLSFPSLTSVGGLDFTTLPVLSALGFGTITTASTIQITDTSLESLSGINLKRAEMFSITNNRYLSTISMPTLAQVDTSFTVSSNAAGLSLSLPVLTSCGNFTAQQVGNLSINALANVTGSFGIQQTTLTLIQANNLTRITNDLAITNNTQLLNISMPLLQSTSGFTIANNTLLSDIDYPALTTVGAIDLTGTFKTVELPDLTRVEGGVNIQTSATPFTCPISQSSVKSTSFTCKSVAVPVKANTTTGSSTTTTGSSSGSTSSSSSTAKASGAINLQTSSGLVLALVAITSLFM